MTAASGRRVLVVEDDRSIREGIADALAFHGHTPVQAERGDVGIEKALHGGCDLVLLDLVLPGADGLAVLREVRKAQPTLPVIILTARGDESERVFTRAKGLLSRGPRGLRVACEHSLSEGFDQGRGHGRSERLRWYMVGLASVQVKRPRICSGVQECMGASWHHGCRGIGGC